MELTLDEQILILLRERGPLASEEIAHYLGRNVNEVKDELQYLELDKLITRVKRGILFRKEVFDLTPTGLEEAQKAYEKLREISHEILSRISSMNEKELEEFLNQYMALMPLIMILNLLPFEMLIWVLGSSTAHDNSAYSNN
ncbi:hypothetical protein [Vulcanisaeta souniana]|uniref:Uncharacterized protein n=1 Tax=Vulcanisaeta souniana JCM 11219 TaxID=1293586 RepID=A0A830E5P4_9CREN|nr:hypothetical protein [Vulcanisaeta souniana]BDR92875.1 hypothetical protein Vsou_19680 [Vulcanisaeta souniana JCM 11219]GGI85325.1 hypothetical protein GCM10007112_22920 [Vulcanisaeta souniana JCM 11219]